MWLNFTVCLLMTGGILSLHLLHRPIRSQEFRQPGPPPRMLVSGRLPSLYVLTVKISMRTKEVGGGYLVLADAVNEHNSSIIFFVLHNIVYSIKSNTQQKSH